MEQKEEISATKKNCLEINLINVAGRRWADLMAQQIYWIDQMEIR